MHRAHADNTGLPTLLRSIGGREKPYGHMFRALINGDLPFDLTPGAMLTARIRIRREDVEPLRTAILARPSYITFPAPRTFTQMDVCDILNLHVRNRDAVLELDHRRTGGAMFESSLVAQVARTRATAGEIAARLGLSAMTIAAQLRTADLFPIDAFGWDRRRALSTIGLEDLEIRDPWTRMTAG